MLKQIKSFSRNYDFLSNFYDTPVDYNSITYQNSEAAFQAQKTLDETERLLFTNAAPNVAKRMGRKLKIRDDWNEVRVKVMYEVVSAKFKQNLLLAARLLETGDTHLEEGNTWGDTFWGTVNGVGENNLGKILMQVRQEINSKKCKRNAKDKHYLILL